MIEEIKLKNELQPANEFFSAVIEQSPELQLLLSFDGKIEYSNSATSKYLEYSPQELIGMNFIELIHPDYRTFFNASFNNVRKGNQEWVEYEVRLKGKSEREIFCTGIAHQLIYSSNQKGVFLKLIKKNLAKDGIGKTSAHNSDFSLQLAILNALPSNIALLDKEGKIIIINDRWKRFIAENKEISGEYTCGNNYLKIAENAKAEYYDNAIKIANGIKSVLSGASPKFSMDYQFGALEGAKWFTVQVTPLSPNLEDGVVVMHIDITSSKQDEEKLREINKRFELITLATHDAIWDWNLLTNEVYWNDSYEKNYGSINNDKSSLFEDWEKRIHPEDRERVILSLKKELSNPTKGFWESEYRYLKSDGNMAYIYDRGYIVFDENKVPVRMVGAMQDDTARKVAELERDQTTTDLIHRNRDLEQFAYIVSHNLRGPVANIIGCIDVIQHLELNEEDKKGFLEGLAISVKKLDVVIKDLNYILQVKRDVNEKKTKVNLNHLIEDIRSSIINEIHKSQTLIKTYFATDEILTIKSYIHSIFYNLITNSIKYRRPETQPIIEITSRKEDDHLILTFSDNGMGIDLKRKGDKVFGLYKRFHENIEGKGMGLFMVKTQVESLGGNIKINSEANKGTQFTIVIPI